MPLFRIGKESLDPIAETTFEDAGLREREDLQRLLREQVEVISPNTYVIAEEFGEWEDSRRRIDLLAVDRDANLVVIELKRTQDGGHMELQALRYASMVATMTFEQVVDAHRGYLASRGVKDDAESRILAFLGWAAPDAEHFGRDVRIVLASAEFSKELTTAVIWLNERNLDITCVRLRPYHHGSEILLDVQQVLPLPEAEEYQVRLRGKASEERLARQSGSVRAERLQRFWTRLLTIANERTPLHRTISPGRENWLGPTSFGLQLNYVVVQQGGRVELAIARPNRAENKAIFRELLEHKAVIEKVFGGALDWQLLPDAKMSRIASHVLSGSSTEEETWPVFQKDLIETMIRFEEALRPHIAEYQHGARPKVETEEAT